MPDFEKLEQEIQQEAQDHGAEVDKGIADGEQQITDRVGQSSASEIQDAGTAAEKALGTNQQAATGGQPEPESA